jgi:AMP nucleosidase
VPARPPTLPTDLTIDFAAADSAAIATGVAQICDGLVAVDDAGWYPELEVDRPWSEHNPVLQGEFARPAAIRWYLERELRKLALSKARITVRASRPQAALDDPGLLSHLDEAAWDLRRKKLFLFRAERAALSIDRLEHYTGTHAEDFQRYVLFTNYEMHVDAFLEMFPDATRPTRDGVQMPAFHHSAPDHAGITLVNIGVGPANAKTITDHLAVLRPDAMIMVGHCGGLRNHQAVGDLVLATGYMRGDHVLDDVLPTSVPLSANHFLNELLIAALDERSLRYRMGTVYTTGDRNWDLNPTRISEEIRLSRSIAIDMESATIAANGFRYRIPSATLLCVSDKPLHGSPKLADDARAFYDTTRHWHLAVAADVVERVRASFGDGLPTAGLRSDDEPLFGTA